MTGPTVSAAVLAGGESRRFGTDKALFPVPGGTTPMLAAVVQSLLSVTWDVTVVAPESREYAQFGVPVISELTPGQGPLSAIDMALRHAAYDRCIVVACDLPFLSPRLLRWMCQLDLTADALVPMVPAGQDGGSRDPIPRPQPLHAIYRRTCLDAVHHLLVAGERRMGRLLDRIDVRYLSEEEIRPFDPDLRSFMNLNSIDEWRSARHWVDP